MGHEKSGESDLYHGNIAQFEFIFRIQVLGGVVYLVRRHTVLGRRQNLYISSICPGVFSSTIIIVYRTNLTLFRLVLTSPVKFSSISLTKTYNGIHETIRL